MKYILVTSLVLSSAVSAQSPTDQQTTEEANKKRPSWSQGLPERQKVLKPGAPALNVDSSTRSDIEAPIVERVQTEQPKFELEQLEVPTFDHQIEIEAPVLDQTDTQPPQRLDARAKSQRRTLITKEDNPLHDKYQWEVVHTTPIEMPSHLNSKGNIEVIIYIKPDGSVSKVTSRDPDVTSTMLKYVSESIQNWRFEAPNKIGISEVMSKQFAIEIKS
ncbi:hypothetical protein [Marinicella rhabdoformis]|uniref:hypothetical protein n=1 Tax=Marinicella rhabdoformis TaxID=2580566 RepID=UPI0012AEBCD4|nr:hypothetical protein [Marinicella rhabdoformis]